MERKSWEEMRVDEVGSVDEVLRVSQGGGKPSMPVEPDHGMETVNSPKGQE